MTSDKIRDSRLSAILALIIVIVLYPVFGYILRNFLQGVEVAGYTVKWGVLPTVFIALLCILWTFRSGNSWRDLGVFRPVPLWKTIIVGVISVPVIYLLIAVIVSVLLGSNVIASPETSGKMTVEGPNKIVSVVCTLFLMWIVAAFCEELIFRGFLLTRLAEAFGGGTKHWLGAVVIIAVLFGAAHIPAQGGYGFVLTGLAGLFLGLLYIFGGKNLWVVVIAHGLINSLSLV